MMQRFTLIHDGSRQGWQTAYLAFHVADSLGAPIQILLTGSKITKKEVLMKRAIQLETGARAAGVTIKIRYVKSNSVKDVAEAITSSDGFFAPHRIIPNGETALRFLKALSRPLWIVKGESETHKMAVLAGKELQDKELLNYALILSNRLEGALTGLFIKNNPTSENSSNRDLVRMQVQDFSLPVLTNALKQLQADLLFMNASKVYLVSKLRCTCVVHPAGLLK